ncbi:hypothetical protein [Spirosoma pomorum]
MRTRLLILVFWAIGNTAALAQLANSPNPAAPGFNRAGSDHRAIQIADQVMAAMGGRQAWEDTHLIAWTFQNIRRLVWDKWNGLVRIDNLQDDQTVLLNVNNDQGRVYRNGHEILATDSLGFFLRQGKNRWLNDTYWLVLPFKLKDPGVTLKYLGKRPNQTGKPADLLQMTFKQAPDKFWIWVDPKQHLVNQWAHFAKATDAQPMFTVPWLDYKQYGSILLSGERGVRDISDIMVFTGLPGEVFSDFTRTDLSRYPQAH